jgi:hypothetical protein
MSHEDLIELIIACHMGWSKSKGGTYHLDPEYADIDRDEMESYSREMLVAELDRAFSGEQFLGEEDGDE